MRYNLQAHFHGRQRAQGIMSAFSSLFGGSSTDKSVESLFSSSAGPVDRSHVQQKRTVIEDIEPSKEDEEEEENLENEEDEEENEALESEVSGEDKADTEKAQAKKQRKEQKKKEENENLEEEYFAKLLNEQPETKKEADQESTVQKEQEDGTESAGKTTSARVVDLKEDELEKAERTVFVGNVSNTVVSDKKMYRKFKKLFEDIGPVASIRFRSIAFDEALPRKLAFAKRALHSLRDSVNAYVVFKDKTPSRKASGRLNGHVFDHHHLRVDHVAHPAPRDNKRTIFVGNLDFEEKEETLWRYFNHHTDNDVELVRVVRDSKTNMGKGFALVMFKDSLSVNKALFLNDKPMNVDGKVEAEAAEEEGTDDKKKNKKKARKLRISRAKSTAKPLALSPNHVDNQKTKRAKPRATTTPVLTDDQKTKLGRAKALLGRSDRRSAGSQIVEGTRAVKGQRIEGIKGLKSAQGKVKKPRITDRSSRYKNDKKAMDKLGKQK